MVIQLARLYICVKRVFVDSPAFARVRRAEAPLCHEKNVVAYPQNPDAVLPILGLSPQELPKVLVVQFVGGHRQSLQREPALQVDIARLRAALLWLISHNLGWMEATKEDALEEGALGGPLDRLISEFRKSLAGEGPAVPAELLQSAIEIDVKDASVHQLGPAEAVASDEEPEREASGDGPPEAPYPDESVAVLQGGWDDFTPMQFWDILMKKHRVAEQCTEALEAAKGRAHF